MKKKEWGSLARDIWIKTRLEMHLPKNHWLLKLGLLRKYTYGVTLTLLRRCISGLNIRQNGGESLMKCWSACIIGAFEDMFFHYRCVYHMRWKPEFSLLIFQKCTFGCTKMHIKTLFKVSHLHFIKKNNMNMYFRNKLKSILP